MPNFAKLFSPTIPPPRLYETGPRNLEVASDDLKKKSSQKSHFDSFFFLLKVEGDHLSMFLPKIEISKAEISPQGT